MDASMSPFRVDTEVLDPWTWRPKSLQALREEARYLMASSQAIKSGFDMLFRGQENAKWEIQSTSARNPPKELDPKHKFYGNQLHHMFLRKFGDELRPHTQLFDAERNHGIDPWFELMKRIQQYPKEFDKFGGWSGTFLVDWSINLDVALAFAGQEPDTEGAVYFFDYPAVGNNQANKPVRWFLDKMQDGLRLGDLPGMPIVFCPAKQLDDDRANRQGARYVAQMDLRHSLDKTWQAFEKKRSDGQRIYWRLLLNQDVKHAVSKCCPTIESLLE